MNSKSDVNRRVLAIQAKKKRHKGNKKRGKQQANGGGGGGGGGGVGCGGGGGGGLGGASSTNNSDQMHHTSSNAMTTSSGPSKTHFVTISPTLAATEKLCKASIKSESLKMLAAAEGKAGPGGRTVESTVREHYENDEETFWSKEKVLLRKDGKKVNKLHHPNFRPHHQYVHSHSAGRHPGNENNDHDVEDNEDVDLDVDDVDEDEDDEELADADGNNAATSRSSLTVDVKEKGGQQAPYLGTPSNESDDEDDGEEESEPNSENEEQELKKDYCKGGYHPVNIGDLFQGKIK